jgi:hypothetical protein
MSLTTDSQEAPAVSEGAILAIVAAYAAAFVLFGFLAYEPACSATVQWRRHLLFTLRIDCRKRSWLGIVHRSTVRRITLVGTTAVFDLSSTSYSSNINCLCGPETAKIVRTAANRLTSVRAGADCPTIAMGRRRKQKEPPEGGSRCRPVYGLIPRRTARAGAPRLRPRGRRAAGPPALPIPRPSAPGSACRASTRSRGPWPSRRPSRPGSGGRR